MKRWPFQRAGDHHLDTIVTTVDVDTVVIYPVVVDTLQSVTGHVRRRGAASQPACSFRSATAYAIGIDRPHHIDTDLDPGTAEREQ